MILANCKKPIDKYRIHISNTINKRKVINLPGKNLSEPEISILSKGLNFCPTPKEMKKEQFFKEMDNFQRNLSLKLFFNKETESNINPPPPYQSTTLEKIIRQRNPKPFEPPRENCVVTFTDAIKDDIERSKQVRNKPNVTKTEFEAINKLSKCNDIVIKKADKGGATVVVSSDWYREEGLRQLSNEEFYKQVDTDDTAKHEQMIKETLDEFVNAKEIDTKVAKQLTPSDSRTPEFYLLPKIHKDPITGRPVISSSGCHTEKISAYVDEHLKIGAQELPSYIKDSNDFNQKIKKIGKISPGNYLVTMDVSSLYTNIDNEEGIKAIRNNASLKSRYSEKFISFICTLMYLILTLNNFIFNGKNYHQIKGTAMGTRAAPNYANIFMGWFEDEYVYKSVFKQNISFYGRYIDDIFMIWNGSLVDLQKFLSYINGVHPSIKFTYEFSKERTEFLDMIIFKDLKGYLTTDVYQKPTDTHNYLHYNSSHPRHCTKSIPFSQFLRLKRLISEPATLKRRLHEYIEYFVNAGYSRKQLKILLIWF